MDLGSLKIFHATATAGSVSKAAKSLNCVQSNVTARIRQLEGELGVQLFYRKKRGMVLTRAGHILMDYAQKAIVLFREAEKAVQEPLAGPLNIGALESTAAARLPAILTRFHREYPEVNLTIHTASHARLVDMVLAYQLDAAFVEDGFASSDLTGIRIFSEQLVVAGGRDAVPPESDACPTLIVFQDGCTYRRILTQWLASRGIRAFKVMEFGSHEGILGCVSAGLGITLFPVSLVRRLNYQDRLRIFKLPREISDFSIHLIRRKDLVVTRALTEFEKIVRQTAD